MYLLGSILNVIEAEVLNRIMRNTSMMSTKTSTMEIMKDMTTTMKDMITVHTMTTAMMGTIIQVMKITTMR